MVGRVKEGTKSEIENRFCDSFSVSSAFVAELSGACVSGAVLPVVEGFAVVEVSAVVFSVVLISVEGAAVTDEVSVTVTCEVTAAAVLLSLDSVSAGVALLMGKAAHEHIKTQPIRAGISALTAFL